VLTDLARFSTALPSDCVGRFTVGVPASGKGAQARLRYDMAAMHRTLNMTVSRVDVQAGRAVVDHDHAGNRGFVSRWFMEAKEDGTHVKVTTPINAPPWPFTKYYFEAVKPEWDACQGRFVENVAMAAAAGP
jgi:NADPH-dependent ferric siderophore reductase